jgi:hypothetical protein
MEERGVFPEPLVEQQIVARLTDMISLKKMPVLPRWIQPQVERATTGGRLLSCNS